MSQDDLADRLDAVERRLDAAYPEPRADAGNAEELVECVEAFAERLANLEAAVEAVEGYVGEIERVDDELERRADAALAAADGLEDRIGRVEELLRERSSPAADLQALRRDLDAIEDRVAAVEPDSGSIPVRAEDRFDGASSNAIPDGAGSVVSETGAWSTPRQQSKCTCDRTAPAESGDERSSEPVQRSRSTADGGTDTPGETALGGPDFDPSRSGIQVDDGATESVGDGRISGWGAAPTAAAGRETTGVPDGATGTAPDDRSWSDGDGETLLDRLRAML